MLRIYVAQQRQLLRMARKITLPQTDCRQGSKRWLLSSGNSVWSGNSVSTGSSISRCTPLACDSRSSFSLDTSVLMAVAKACLVGQVGLVCSSVSSTLHLHTIQAESSRQTGRSWGQQWNRLKGLITSGSVLWKTAIFPKKEGRKREISNESARGSSLHEANV